MPATSGKVLRFDIELEKEYRNTPNKVMVQTQLDRLAKVCKRNKSYKFSVTTPKILEPESFDTIQPRQDGTFLVKARLRLLKRNFRSEDKVRSDFNQVYKNLQAAARMQQWKMAEQGEKDAVEDLGKDRLPLIVPQLSPEVLNDYFGKIYERDAHIRLIHDSLTIAVDTKFKVRGHCLLFGEPGSCKTTIFKAFKSWIEKIQEYERVSILDSTAATKAGLIKFIKERARAGLLPEIEKVNQDNLHSLLSLMDDRASIEKTNFRDQSKEDAPVLVFATCNNEQVLQQFHHGALWDRFIHKMRCRRPSAEILIRILIDKVKELPNYNIVWATEAKKLADKLEIQHPREVIGLLDGRDRLLDGSYEKDLLETHYNIADNEDDERNDDKGDKDEK
jgi:MoxR-like ATPase